MLGTLNIKDMGYIMGVTDHLQQKERDQIQHHLGANIVAISCQTRMMSDVKIMPDFVLGIKLQFFVK